MKYIKKPIEVEAEQYLLGKNMWHYGGCDQAHNGNKGGWHVHTLEGTSYDLQHGDWIIKGIKGEFYPCKPDIFTATYEPAPQRK